MPKIQLIIEAESARHLASVINQMAHRYKQDETGESDTPSEAKSNGAGTSETHPEAGDERADYVAPKGKSEFPDEPKPLKGAAKAAAARKAAAQAPPPQPDEEEDAPGELPPLDELKAAITKAVLSEPQGGPIRTALETFRGVIKVNLIKNTTEEHRPALFAFIQTNKIPLDAQV